jgi:uncharacterized protein HemX
MQVDPDPYTGERPKTMSETESRPAKEVPSKGGGVMMWVILAVLLAIALIVGLGGNLFGNH